MKSNYILEKAIRDNEDLATYFFKKIDDANTVNEIKSSKFKEWKFYKGLLFFIIPGITATGLIGGAVLSSFSVSLPLIGCIPLSILLSNSGIDYYKKNYKLNTPEKVAMKIKLNHADFIELAKYINEKYMLELIKSQDKSSTFDDLSGFISAIEEKTGKKINISKKDKNLNTYVSSLYLENENNKVEKK